jgi:hypothetical protein
MKDEPFKLNDRQAFARVAFKHFLHHEARRTLELLQTNEPRYV